MSEHGFTYEGSFFGYDPDYPRILLRRFFGPKADTVGELPWILLQLTGPPPPGMSSELQAELRQWVIEGIEKPGIA